MNVQISFWAQAKRIASQFLDAEGGGLLKIDSLVNQILVSSGSAQHQATSELFSMLGRLPNASEIGAMLGRRIPVTAFGEMSLAVKVAPTISDALQVIAEFQRYIFPLLDYSYRETPSEGRFAVGFSSPIDSRGEAVLVMMAACLIDTECARYSGRNGNIRKLELTPSSKGCEASYRKHLSLVPDTNQPINVFVLDRSVLDLPNPIADPDTFADVVATYRARNNLRGVDISTSVKVRERIMSNISAPPELAGIAASLQMSPRQLRLALAKEDANYQSIVRSCRIEYASALFRNPALSVSQVAERLGYSDPSAFTHAFSRWTGKSPSTFRIEMLARAASR